MGGAPEADPPLVFITWVAREIDLRLEQVNVELLEGDGISASGAAASVVSFNIESLAVRMTTDSTGYSISEYDLQSVLLCDLRHNMVNMYPKTLSSKSGGKQELHLTQVNYTNGDKEFMLTMEHPHIVLLPWAYRELWGFIYPLFDSAITHFDLWVNDGEVPAPGPPPAERPEWTFRVTITDPGK
jgi:hypothetical protein